MASQSSEIASVVVTDKTPSDHPPELLTSEVSNDQLQPDEEDDHVFSKDAECTPQLLSHESTSLTKGKANEAASVTVIEPSKEGQPDTSAQVLSPTATTSASGGTRRPSYTSKAPSALTNLPGITVSDFSPQSFYGVVSPNNQNGAALKGLLNINAKNATQPTSPRPNLATIRQKNSESVGSFGQSFDESLDGYSNPGTPSSVRADSPTASSGNGSVSQMSKHIDIREKNKLAFKTKWDEAIKTDVLTVKCRDMLGYLYKSKLGSGSKGKCIKTVEGHWITPTEFEARAGRKACKDWKRSIRYAGQTLQKLIDEGILSPHAVSCTCATCGGDETLTGPVKLFVPYKGKRKRPNDMSSTSKPLDDILHEHPRMRSMSVDSEVFLHGPSSLVHDDMANIPPMTPVTPMTPITPVTPFTPMTPLTPGLCKPTSPPRSVTINAPSGLSMLGSMATTNSVTVSAFGSSRPPATPTRVQAGGGDTSLNIVSHQHWIQLEEVASSILSMAQQLKIMIEQAKVQSEALRESAVAQARIQAETDKREAISQIRYQSLAQLSQALATAQADKGDTAQPTILKTCQNCGREAPLECTGCNKIYYCGVFCQKKDWTNHQKNCRDAVHEHFQLSAAAAAAAASKESGH